MTFRHFLTRAASVLALSVAAAPASAQLVTYSWTTTSVGFGNFVGQPTSATFQVALSAVQTGRINQSDITNIQLAYPGLTFDAYAASSGGLDNATFVNPMTGALIYSSPNQGLAVIGFQGGLFSDSFLSITVGNPSGTSVADQFNALRNGGPFAGFPTAGFWTAQLPTLTAPVPEPATWAMLILGFGFVGGALRSAKQNRKLAVSYS